MLLIIEVKQLKTFFITLLVQSFIIGWSFNFGCTNSPLNELSVGRTVLWTDSPWYEQSVEQTVRETNSPGTKRHHTDTTNQKLDLYT